MWSLIKPKARHLMALAVFLPLLLIVLYIVTKNTDAYNEAVRFVAEDDRVAASIGTVQRTDFKFWEGFEFTGSKADFSIEATSERGRFVANVSLRRVTGVWRVEAAEIRGHGSLLTRIVPQYE